MKKWREGSRWYKRYDQAQTAYQRLCACGVLGRKETRALRDLYQSLDPLDLKDQLEKRLKKVLRPVTRLPRARCE